MTRRHPIDHPRERAALYALGTLNDGEAREFEAHLQSGCATCRAEVDNFAAATAELGFAVPPQRPRSLVRERVLARVAAEDALAYSPRVERDGVHFVRADHLPWVGGDGPGIEIKTLAVDRVRGYVTQLVRMPPGSSLRPHRHVDAEESYVLEGDLLVSGVLMQAGDYCRADAGSVHEGVRTEQGCLFIAVYSMRDEALA